jgi:hypothetical protein
MAPMVPDRSLIGEGLGTVPMTGSGVFPDLEERVHVCGQATMVDDHDGLGLVGNTLPHRRRAQIEGVRLDIGEDGANPGTAARDEPCQIAMITHFPVAARRLPLRGRTPSRWSRRCSVHAVHLGASQIAHLGAKK